MSILTYKGYQGSFEYDPDADIFHGDVLHINDVITFQGRAIEELKTAMADSVELYLEYCAQKGRTPNNPFSARFNMRKTPEVHQHIAIQAARDNLSLFPLSLNVSEAASNI